MRFQVLMAVSMVGFFLCCDAMYRFSTQKIEAASSSEMLAPFYRTIQHHTSNTVTISFTCCFCVACTKTELCPFYNIYCFYLAWCTYSISSGKICSGGKTLEIYWPKVTDENSPVSFFIVYLISLSNDWMTVHKWIEENLEAAMANLRYYPSISLHSLGETLNTSTRNIHVPTEIQTECAGAIFSVKWSKQAESNCWCNDVG
jgi:hypothetical protein